MGLDPARFWDITPRLMAIEMRGAAIRLRREREMTWLGAMLPHMAKPVSLETFVGIKPQRDDRRARWAAAWDKIDAALERGR